MLAEHHTLFKLAITETFKQILGDAFETDVRDAWIHFYDFIRNNWEGYDMDTEDRDEYDGLTVLRQRIVQYSWKQVKHLLGEQC
mgnify:FL=1